MSDQFDLSWMVGRTITEVVPSPASTQWSLSTEDGAVAKAGCPSPFMWSFNFEDGSEISAECPWRLLQEGHIFISNEDHQQKYGLPAPLDAALVAADMLRSKIITSVEIKAGTSDLVLKFVDSLQLEIVPFSSGYESWGISMPSGFRIVAQGGGEISGWQNS